MRIASKPLSIAVLFLACGLGSDVRAQGSGTQKPAPSAAPQTAKPAAPRATTAKPPTTAKPVETAKPKPFTNEDIIKLKAAAFSDDRIAAAIEAAPNKVLDTSADGLISLKNAGVSDAIIDVVLGKPFAPAVAKAPRSDAAPEAPTPLAPEQPRAATIAPAPAPEPVVEKRGGLLGALNRVNPVRVVRDDGGDVAGTGTARPKDQNIKNGEPWVIQTALPTPQAASRVHEFLDSKNLRPEIQGNTVKTDWSAEHKCPGFTVAKCQDQIEVRIADNPGGAQLRLFVVERRANQTSHQWSNGQVKADPTKLYGAELEVFLQATR